MHPIKHVVVLMLENRSFDSVVGQLYPSGEKFDGLVGGESNPWHRPGGPVEHIRVWTRAERGVSSAPCLPDPDPGELFSDMNMQIFGLDSEKGRAKTGAAATMSGFVDNYMRQPTTVRLDPKSVMYAFSPEELPVMSTLANTFGVSDRWHASAPCETWPNRYFAHCGTAGGEVNNEHSRFPHHWPRAMPTIFRRLDARGYRWRVYFHDLPQTATLLDLWPKIPTRFSLFEAEFARHARTGQLPHYSFIEPRYYANIFGRKLPNDQHPPHPMLYGEQLIADVYNALRAAPSWKETLLVVTYDEHGGCYDHVPPPAAVPPGKPYPDDFIFDRYGVRVPALIISPYVRPGSVIRPPPVPPGTRQFPFDHCSIAATLHRIFDLGPPLTPRVAAAPHLLSALSLPRPDNDGPARIVVEERPPSGEELRAYARRAQNHHQRNLRKFPLGLAGSVAATIAQIRGLGAKMIPEAWSLRR